ncbi:MAG: hypothetical protein V4590_06125 [Bacteroidota bacterium]
MKQLSLIIFLLLISNCIRSQSIKPSEYIGTLRLSNKQIITYKINFSEISPGKIEGTSVTDIYGKNKTQSIIKGAYNEQKKKFSFYETQNISSRSTTDKNEFCYVHVADADIKIIDGKYMLRGTFTGKYPDGKVCATGSLYLMATQDLQALSKELLTPETIKNEDSLKLIQEKVNTLLARKEETALKGNDVLFINTTGNELVMEIWDGGAEEDNDIISIWVNNTVFIEKVVIKKEKKTITVPLVKGKSHIKIVALYEGKSQPCTANMLIKDQNNSSPIVTILKRGESATVEITN